MKIRFLNHASAVIETEHAVILTDPWFEGASFNNGWDLLAASPDVEAAMKNITHIWISHEHPDHFSPSFFLSLSQDVKERIEIIFQDTRDKRVCGFLRGKGFRVRELRHHQPHRIEATELCIGKSSFYDSYLHLKSGSASLLNLNDCPINDDTTLKKIRHRFGLPTVLLSQFSYAAWKGGRESRAVRRQFAYEKLMTLKRQASCLQPEYLIPFASFIYFSNEENFYMNDSVNTIDSVFESLKDSGTELITLKPGESWVVGDRHDNTNPRLFWREKFSGITSMPRRKPGNSADEATLQEAFKDYKARVLTKNNAVLIRLARWVPGLGVFRPINIKLSDLGIYQLDFNTGLSPAPGEPHDVEMHSSSLLFIFNNEFGYDTLTVNARFEASGEGFSKMTKFLAIGSLNAMGLSLNFGFVRHFAVAWQLLKQLRRVRKGMAL